MRNVQMINDDSATNFTTINFVIIISYMCIIIALLGLGQRLTLNWISPPPTQVYLSLPKFIKVYTSLHKFI